MKSYNLLVCDHVQDSARGMRIKGFRKNRRIKIRIKLRIKTYLKNKFAQY